MFVYVTIHNNCMVMLVTSLNDNVCAKLLIIYD